MNEEIEQELISKFTDRLTDISNFEYDLLEAQAVGFIALVRADDARRLRELSYDTEWIEDIASIRPSQLRDLADTWEGK
jgi:hypothetical protein